MRFPERNFDHSYLNRFFKFTEKLIQTNPEVAQDETTEQVFSRKTDRKAYRQAVLKQRTAEAKAREQGTKNAPAGQRSQSP